MDYWGKRLHSEDDAASVAITVPAEYESWRGGVENCPVVLFTFITKCEQEDKLFVLEKQILGIFISHTK